MYNDFDDEIENRFYSEGYTNCLSCPYSFREYSFRPQSPGNVGSPNGGSRPPGPPPATTPYKNETPGLGTKAVSPGAIQPCINRYVYIWLENGRSFWAWLIHVDRRTASGFRWSNRRWVYFGIDLRSIESFECY